MKSKILHCYNSDNVHLEKVSNYLHRTMGGTNQAIESIRKALRGVSYNSVIGEVAFTLTCPVTRELISYSSHSLSFTIHK